MSHTGQVIPLKQWRHKLIQKQKLEDFCGQKRQQLRHSGGRTLPPAQVLSGGWGRASCSGEERRYSNKVTLPLPLSPARSSLAR